MPLGNQDLAYNIKTPGFWQVLNLTCILIPSISKEALVKAKLVLCTFHFPSSLNYSPLAYMLMIRIWLLKS